MCKVLSWPGDYKPGANEYVPCGRYYYEALFTEVQKWVVQLIKAAKLETDEIWTRQGYGIKS